MPRYKEEAPAIRVYTVCDESRNVPALGCGDDLLKLFSSYGEVEEFARRKLDDFVFLGNPLQVSYASHFESLSDTKDKLVGRRREVLARFNQTITSSGHLTKTETVTTSSEDSFLPQHSHFNKREYRELEEKPQSSNPPNKIVSSNEDYFGSPSMNQTVRLVREKLDKIQSSGDAIQAGSASKKTRDDNKRRI